MSPKAAPSKTRSKARSTSTKVKKYTPGYNVNSETCLQVIKNPEITVEKLMTICEKKGFAPNRSHVRQAAQLTKRVINEARKAGKWKD